MATLSDADRLKKLNELTQQLGNPYSVAHIRAAAQLKALGYNVQQTPNGFTIKDTTGPQVNSSELGGTGAPAPVSFSDLDQMGRDLSGQTVPRDTGWSYFMDAPNQTVSDFLPRPPSSPPVFPTSQELEEKDPRLANILGGAPASPRPSVAPPAVPPTSAGAGAPAIPGAPVYTPPSKPAAPFADPNSPMFQVVPQQRSAYSMGAPAMDDRYDQFGNFIPGTQTFVKGLFASANNAQKALEDYRAANPKADANDPRLTELQNAANAAANDAQAGSKWAAMTPSKRQSILTQGEIEAGRVAATNKTRGMALEQYTAERDRGTRPTNLLEDLDYFNKTGVMRGGAGVGTSTTQAGGVISAPDANGNRTLTSPYGTGSAAPLTANRPEATIEGMPASQYFDRAAMRQGQTIDVGGVRYTPDARPQAVPGASPDEYAKKQLEEANKRAEEERRKFASSIVKR